MMPVPESALGYGFDNGPGGAHTSRTMMLSELRLLLAACPPSATYQQYRTAILAQNVLLKRTEATRRESLRRLRELYGLIPCLLVFRGLRDLWGEAPAEQPLLALLAALARDPLLRATANTIQATPHGAAVTAAMFAETVAAQFPGRMNAMTHASISRHAAASWTQAGHLQGRSHKTRRHPLCGPAAVAYALLLGHLCGARGEALFSTFWMQMTDLPIAQAHEQAFLAAQRGWLEYRHTGAVTEIGFSHLLRKEPIQDE